MFEMVVFLWKQFAVFPDTVAGDAIFSKVFVILRFTDMLEYVILYPAQTIQSIKHS